MGGMGLGKTLTTLATLEAWTHRFKQARVIVCCPNSVIHQWSAEMVNYESMITIDSYAITDSDAHLIRQLRPWFKHGGVVIQMVLPCIAAGALSCQCNWAQLEEMAEPRQQGQTEKHRRSSAQSPGMPAAGSNPAAGGKPTAGISFVAGIPNTVMVLNLDPSPY